MFQCRQQNFETYLELFEYFKYATIVITQYDGSIGQDMGLVNHLGSKEDVQKMFLEVRLVHKSDEVLYSELNIFMHNSYINVK